MLSDRRRNGQIKASRGDSSKENNDKDLDKSGFAEVKKVIKLLGKNNDLRTEKGEITRIGYAVMTLSTILGLCVFLAGRYMYGKSLEKKQ